MVAWGMDLNENIIGYHETQQDEKSERRQYSPYTKNRAFY